MYVGGFCPLPGLLGLMDCKPVRIYCSAAGGEFKTFVILVKVQMHPAHLTFENVENILERSKKSPVTGCTVIWNTWSLVWQNLTLFDIM